MSDIQLGSYEEILSLYNGEVTLIFEPVPHRYYLEEDGDRLLVPSVTNVLSVYAKDGLPWWSADMTAQYTINNLPIADEAQRQQVLSLYLQMKDEKRKEKRELLRQTLGTVFSISVSTTELASTLYDARGYHDKAKKLAADIGQMAHDWLECYSKAMIEGTECTEPMPDDDRAVSCINAALDWMRRHNFKPYFAERRIYSRQYGYMGTLDWLGEVTGCGDPACCEHEGTHVELGDFKSCNAIHDENFMQTAAYLFAVLEEIDTLEIQSRRILKLGKYDGEFESRVRSADKFEGDFGAFLGLMQAFCWKQQDKLDKAEAKLEAKEVKRLAKQAVPAKVKRPRIAKAKLEPIPIAG